MTAEPADHAAGLVARRIAADILEGVLQRRRPLDEQLDDRNVELATLPPRDRALVRLIASTALRRLGTLRHLLGQMRLALSDHDHGRRVMADMAIHDALAEASGNPLNPLLLAAVRAPLEQVMIIDHANRSSEPELNRIVDVHEAIVERVCAGDAVGAGAAMAMHFDLSVGAMSKNEHLAVTAEVPASL